MVSRQGQAEGAGVPGRQGALAQVPALQGSRLVSVADDPLVDAMARELRETYTRWSQLGLSTLGVDIGLGDRHGVIRLAVTDIAQLCARVAREHEVR